MFPRSHGWRSLVGCGPWSCGESDTTEQLLSLFTFMHWRRKWQPTPVFLPGESQGRGSLVGCCLWGRTESDTTEATQHQHQQPVFALFMIRAFQVILYYLCGFDLNLVILKSFHVFVGHPTSSLENLCLSSLSIYKDIKHIIKHTKAWSNILSNTHLYIKNKTKQNLFCQIHEHL